MQGLTAAALPPVTHPRARQLMLRDPRSSLVFLPSWDLQKAESPVPYLGLMELGKGDGLYLWCVTGPFATYLGSCRGPLLSDSNYSSLGSGVARRRGLFLGLVWPAANRWEQRGSERLLTQESTQLQRDHLWNKIYGMRTREPESSPEGSSALQILQRANIAELLEKDFHIHISQCKNNLVGDM